MAHARSRFGFPSPSPSLSRLFFAADAHGTPSRSTPAFVYLLCCVPLASRPVDKSPGIRRPGRRVPFERAAVVPLRLDGGHF